MSSECICFCLDSKPQESKDVAYIFRKGGFGCHISPRLTYRHILQAVTIDQIRHEAVAGTRSSGRLSGCLENVLEVVPIVVLDLDERKE